MIFVFPLSLGLVVHFLAQLSAAVSSGPLRSREMFTTDDILSVAWTVFSRMRILIWTGEGAPTKVRRSVIVMDSGPD